MYDCSLSRACLADEAYEAMRTCPFKNAKALAIGKAHNASVAQVCLRWIAQRGCVMAVGTGADPKQAPACAHYSAPPPTHPHPPSPTHPQPTPRDPEGV